MAISNANFVMKIDCFATIFPPKSSLHIPLRDRALPDP